MGQEEDKKRKKECPEYQQAKILKHPSHGQVSMVTEMRSIFIKDYMGDGLNGH